MAKPSGLPEWDETQVNVTVPDATHKAQGWLVPAGVPEKPSVEYFNYWMNNVFRWLKAVNDLGILGWDSGTTYEIGSYVIASDKRMYGGITATNLNNNPTSSPANWILVGGYPYVTTPAANSILMLDADGALNPNSGSVFRKNAIINGELNTWQRGTTHVSVATGDYTADRFIYSKVGVMVHTIEASTDVPATENLNYSLKLDPTTIDASIAAGDFNVLRNRVEGHDFLPFVGKTATLSYWIKSTKTGVMCVSFSNSVSDRSYVVETTVLATDTWEKKTVTLDFDYSGGTWDYTNGIGIQINWCLAAGSTFHTTKDAWQTGDFLATSNQINFCDSLSNEIYITGVQFEISPFATTLEHRPIGEEFALCQRYFCKSYGVGVTPGTADTIDCIAFQVTAVNAADHTIEFPVRFPVSMRGAATVSLYDLVGAIGKVSMVGNGINGSVAYNGANGFRCSGTAGVSSTGRNLKFHYTANSEL